MAVAQLMALGLKWASNWLFRLPLVWAKRQLVCLVQKSLVVALVVVLFSIVLSGFAMVLHQETLDPSALSAGDPLGLMARRRSLPQDVVRLLRDALLHFAALLSFQEPLTVANLLRHRDRLQSLDWANYELQACLEQAIEGFSLEPPAVQANAQLSIQCAGRALEFLSGQGDCKISVYVLHRHVQYSVQVRTAELYLARLAVRPEPLSVDDLLSVQRRLQAWGVLSKELRDCLEFAVQEFAAEPSCVQDDARMVVDCAGQALSFVAGSGGNQINVYNDREGRLHYRIRVSGLWTSAVRFLNGNWPHRDRRPELSWDKFMESE